MTAGYPLPVLDEVRAAVLDHCASLQDRDGRTGAYRIAPGQRTDLYSSCDVAIMRTIMGEDLGTSLGDTARREWIDHVNSFAFGRSDGSYGDRYGHSPLHANGMVVGALGPLGGRQAGPNRLYDPFDRADKVAAWLESVDWARQWMASHLFWGGLHCFSFSNRCDGVWRDAVFDWLDAELDRETGWWRRGIPHSDRHQPLGGSVHILPLYEHHDRPFPCPERAIDSTLALQRADGRWLDREGTTPLEYLELDALYLLRFLGDAVPDYRRNDIDAALDRYITLVSRTWTERRDSIVAQHPHRILAAVGVFGLLQQHRPDQFPDSARWTDIFSDRRLYAASASLM